MVPLIPSRRWIARILSENAYNRLSYYYLHLKRGRLPKVLDLRNPKTFNEKTIWLKLNQRYPNAHVLADKVLVKDLVRARVGAQYVVPTIKVYESSSDICPEELPSAFILKANHGSGWNIVCPEKPALDWARTISTLDRWLSTNYYDIGKEYQYRTIKPMIICEPLLRGPTPGVPIIDYKVFCFSGIPRFIQVDLDRFTNHSRSFYDTNWNILPFTTLYPRGNRKVPLPRKLDEMLTIAKRLSEGLVFARIDLYLVGNAVYFGEITLHHGGGFEPFIPSRYDRMLGDQIDLNLLPHFETGRSDGPTKTNPVPCREHVVLEHSGDKEKHKRT